MEVLKGTLLLLMVLTAFSVFSYKAPHGMKAMGALASAACATFLVEAIQFSLLGETIGIPFLSQLGSISGGLGGLAAATLVMLSLGVSPVYSMLLGITCSGLGILPGFIAGYLMSFVVKFIEEKVPPGLDLLVVIILMAPLTRFIGVNLEPVVNSTLLAIGDIIAGSTNSSPIIMGIIIGGFFTLISTSPLSSMALTAMLGLTGVPMAIAALPISATSFANFILFKKLKFGDTRDTISVVIEPLTQADIISANPIPIYVTNFISGALGGIVVSAMGLVNNAPGTAAPSAGLPVMFAFNPAKEVLICMAICAVLSTIVGFAASFVFRNHKIVTAAEIRG
ncbi:regulatory protein [[Clostridium] sordellii]|uniref:Membrane protein n=1 Tax=Paraclostridium sordellii TaxID=1505 RepID=A0A9P1P8L3_PARSO|nr:PTS sugar transporter subunit IIC [Paeniclostridium sordellii]AUN13397.1 transcriptional regulator [Paeniclostridium sordellii]MBS6024926.1 PTS sugar transporter subunit IIC [Paeniclostridium sordellii]MBX9180619.1 PTS sugar transporter subunit IIC [Paeniclostridium sordellii]MCH1965231.1 PTS sugar transporter subunit IIC [Paeniclostridium sordellii]MCQ4697806.1 PTS sugar transporter subunit IIC [Paeniclostridium sordellii]